MCTVCGCPRGLRNVDISFGHGVGLSVSSFSKLGRLSVSVVGSTSLPRGRVLYVRLVSSNGLFIFTALYRSLVSSVNGVSSRGVLIESVLYRLRG